MKNYFYFNKVIIIHFVLFGPFLNVSSGINNTSVCPVPKAQVCVCQGGEAKKLSEKWLLITSLSGCSLEQKLPSSVTHSPDRTRPGTPLLTLAIPGLRSTLECRNLISSNSFAHRLGTGNSALRLAPGSVGLKPEFRQGRSEFIYKIWQDTIRLFKSCFQRRKPTINRKKSFIY